MSNATTTRISLDDLAALNAELAALVRARIPLEPELERLARQLPRGAAALAERLGRRMEEGADLATALADEGERLPAMYRGVVAAGQASGNLAGALDDVAATAGRLASLRQTAGISLILPVAVVALASFLAGIVLHTTFSNIAWIAPKTLAPVEQAARSPALFTALTVVVPMVVIVVPLLWWQWSRRATTMGSGRLGQVNWIPGHRRLGRISSAATLSEVMRLMIDSGAPLPDALRTAADATSNRRYRRAARQLAERCATQPDAIANRDAATQSIVEQLPRLVRVALRQSNHRPVFVASLSRAARSYQQRADALGAMLADYVPAMLTLFVAGTATAAFTIGLMWPYTQMLYTLADGQWK